MTKRRLWFSVLGVVVAGAAGYALWFLATQTSFLNQSTPPATVNDNNFNQANTNTAAIDLSTLNPTVIGNAAGPSPADGRSLNVPSAFAVDLFAANLEAPRFFAVLSPSVLVVADKGAGELVWLRSMSPTGLASERKIIDRGLRNVHSVVWFEGDLYSGEENKVVKYHDFQTDGSFSRKEVIINDLPSGGHVTRTVVVGPDKKLYVSVGSSCNVCEEDDERRAAVTQYNLDGTGQRIFARGLRNSVGLAWRGTELWSVDNGRDLLGDNLPPEEVNLLRDGQHYGWPYCYGERIPNPEFSSRADFCTKQTTGPVVAMQAHSAPLGLAVIPEKFSAALAGKLMIAFHGSWNRTERTGYKLVWADPDVTDSTSVNFATGWLEPSGVWGRPVGLGFDSEGVMYVSDDQAGVIYRIRPTVVTP